MGVDPYQLRDRVEQDIASCYMCYGDLVVNNFGHIDYENRLLLRSLLRQKRQKQTWRSKVSMQKVRL